MKIKRFFAADVRSAMRMLKEALGDDAVILSNKKVSGGVELIAAIDYDEAALSTAEMHQPQAPAPTAASAQPPGRPRAGARAARPDRGHQASQMDRTAWAEPAKAVAQDNVMDFSAIVAKPAIKPEPPKAETLDPALQAMRNELDKMRGMLESQFAQQAPAAPSVQSMADQELLQRLGRLGLGRRLSRELLNNLPLENDIDEQWRRVLGKLAVQLPIADDNILTNGGIISLIGPTGVGKTTTIAKLAARYALRYGSRDVALISTDNFRIGAHEQIKAYARILGVPYRFANNAEGLQSALDQFCDRRLVLIDTAGMSQKDLRLSQQLSVLRTSSQIQNYLVMSATARLSGMDEVVQAFGNVELAGTILTKVDESVTLGQAMDVLIRHRLPLAYISDGQRVPEDLQPARAHTVVTRSVAMMQENECVLDNEWDGIGAEEVSK